MEAKEIVCSKEGCGCKAICYREEEGEKELFCVWHCDFNREEYIGISSGLYYVDICVITEEDIGLIEKAQEVFEQVFAQKERSEKDQSNRDVYKLISLYFNKKFNFLLKICRKWRKVLMEWKDRMSKLLRNENEKLLKSEVIKERLKRAKEIYVNSKNVSRYGDLKTLFDLLSVSNDNIGTVSFGKNSISTEETKENICFSIGNDIRSGILDSYYLIEGVYLMKKPFQSSNLSQDIICALNAMKDLDKPSSKFKDKVKEPDVNDKFFAANTLKLNNDLSDIASIHHHDKACEIGCTFKTLDSDEQKEIIESYRRYLRITSTLILNLGFRDIKFSQLKDNLLFKKNTSGDPITNINFENNYCQHYEKGDTESSYYLPELGAQLGFMHRFHKAYFFCSEYVPLFKFDPRHLLESFYRILNFSLREENINSYKRLNLKLEDPII